MYTSAGKIKIEAKADMKKRLGHSPDLADGLMLCFAPPGLAASSLVDFA